MHRHFAIQSHGEKVIYIDATQDMDVGPLYLTQPDPTRPDPVSDGPNPTLIGFLYRYRATTQWRRVD